ncbi:MAG: D-2-hydroxyacid dehydrogenase [Bacteroidales bacterium]|nr:D-2-hydroxyacid dehydrogenase [Bacteroidales bacterium]
MNALIPTIVFLDAYSIGDADMSALSAAGKFISYENTTPEQVIKRCTGADIVITNKVKLMQPELEALPKLKLICIAATGMNNVDLKVAAEKGITVKNVADYSTNSVAELTFTMALDLIHQTHYYDQYVKSGTYSRSGRFTHHGRSFFEIKGKKWGIIGMGHIGRRVAEIASAFGAEISYHSTSGKNLQSGYPHKELDDLLSESDIISIHAPLNEQTQYLIDYQKLCLMKPAAYLINVGRGGIVKEKDLAQALRENRLAGAGLDVYEQEPTPADNPLLSPDLQEKLLMTPHIAWASAEARQRLVDIMVEQIQRQSKIWGCE